MLNGENEADPMGPAQSQLWQEYNHLPRQELLTRARHSADVVISLAIILST